MPYIPDYHERQSYRRAICFFCRCNVIKDGDGYFNEHPDVERNRWGAADLGRPRRMNPLRLEICVGSGQLPLPLAPRWPDGTKTRSYW